MRGAYWCCLLLSLCGCGVDYYLHLARGQARILWRARPVAEVLAEGRLAPDAAQRLRLIAQLRDFASRRLGLRPGDSFTRYYDTGGEPVSWNISASPPDRFAPHLWRFPIVGELPYKGFFSRERAARERDELLGAGLDVSMGGVSAYSTLGYFADPVLSTMLEEDEAGLAELVLHELTHGTIYPEGQAEYSESAATFVGQAGSLLFLSAKYGEGAPEVQDARLRQEDAHRFSIFIREVADSLDSLYERRLPRDQVLAERQAVFARAKDRFRSRRGEFARDHYDGFLRWEVNNARLLAYRRYHRDLELFAQVWKACGSSPDRAVGRFRACGEEPDPWQCLAQAP